MLLSMTGIGGARLQDDRMTVLVEVRAVNNRYLKLTLRASEPYSALEPEIERLVRAIIKRGTVHLILRVDRPRKPEDYRLNLVALGSYHEQLASFVGPHMIPPELAALLTLPGVVEERRAGDADPHDEWPVLGPVVAEALARLQDARAVEGRAMATGLLALADAISGHLERIAGWGPEVVAGYQARLTERVQALVSRSGITVEPADLIREVAILAERADIAEEVVRLRAHLVQFEGLVRGPEESAGRKLEFLVQEMGRETNTIGSKANDVAISREVVEIKGRLESIRELIQNVE